MATFKHISSKNADYGAAGLNEQAKERLDLIIEQMKAAEGVTEELKARNQLEWVGRRKS